MNRYVCLIPSIPAMDALPKSKAEKSTNTPEEQKYQQNSVSVLNQNNGNVAVDLRSGRHTILFEGSPFFGLTMARR
jgi:hypothetical protein